MTMNHYHGESGFSMIEVLVSLLVLSIGALGLAGLQFFALKYNHSSYQRSQATALAYELADRMRANRAQAVASAYALAQGTVPTSSANCNTSSCSSDQIAAYDLATWYSHLTATLAGGTAAVTCIDSSCSQTSQHTITVYWPEADLKGVAMASCSASGAPAGNSCVQIAFQP